MRRLLLLVPVTGLAVACGGTTSVTLRAAAPPTTSAPAPALTPTPATTSASPAPPPSSTAPPRTVARSTTPKAAPPATAAPQPTLPPLPPFASSASAVDAAALGSTWHDGCPVDPSGLQLLSLSYVGFDGAAHTGQLVVNASVAGAVTSAFADLYAHRFPIRSMITVDHYGGSDEASVSADNTAGFNCRAAVNDSGTTSWSMHAYGDAIDVDPVENPYLYGGKVDPPNGAPYANRSNIRPGMAYSGGELVSAFARIGWKWGASFGDYQHFSTNGK